VTTASVSLFLLVSTHPIGILSIIIVTFLVAIKIINNKVQFIISLTPRPHLSWGLEAHYGMCNHCVIQWCQLPVNKSQGFRVRVQAPLWLLISGEMYCVLFAAHPCPQVSIEGFWSLLHCPTNLLPIFWQSTGPIVVEGECTRVSCPLQSWEKAARPFMSSNRL